MFEGIIYKITGVCGKVYIGSTCDYNKRKKGHNSNHNSTASKNLVKPLQFEKIRTDTYKLIKTMLLVEQYYIDIYKCINEKRAYSNKFIKRKYCREMYKNNKNYKKNRYQNNREEILKKKKITYQNNREELLKKAKVKINCPYCNSLITKNHLKKHQRTKKCLKFQTGINPLD